MTVNPSNGGALTAGQVAGFDERFRSDPKSNLMQNVVTRRDVNEVALDHSIVREAEHTFSTRLDDWGVTNQARSGRCWMFAGLNMFRVDSKDVLNVKEFEFSQNYVMFWDKLERANFLLEAIIETADRPVDDRTVAWLLSRGVEDGGAMGHVRQRRQKARGGAQVSDAGDGKLQQHDADEHDAELSVPAGSQEHPGPVRHGKPGWMSFGNPRKSASAPSTRS